MELADKDLLSIQETRNLIARAKTAQKELAKKNQAQVDAIVRAIAEAGVANAQRLAQMAVEDTGFGRAEHKLVKNVFASRDVYNAVKDMKTIGEISRDDTLGVRVIAVPKGVVAGLIPSTNPTSTALFKAEVAIKSGNAIVFSPHPTALRCIMETVRIIKEAVVSAGGSADLVGCISMPTMQATDCLMKHPDTAIILATGGSAMVKAAYSSGTPAIGVGPGNGPAFIERSADVPLAVKRILDSKTFDNGTICASEQSVICEADMSAAVRGEMSRQGCYFLNDEEKARLSKFILRANGTMNPQIVGKDAQTLARLSGLTIPAGTRVLVAQEDGVGKGHPYAHEKLTPILAFFTAENYEKVTERVIEILESEGAGHTAIIHSNNERVIEYYSARVPASRVLVNTAGALGGIGATTRLLPSLTLGCGAVGGSATSENVGPLHLMDLRYVACGKTELEEIMSTLPAAPKNGQGGLQSAVSSAVTAAGKDIDPALVEAIVKNVLERFKNK